ncbi:DUF3541 domain-containing protein [Thiohalocapsa sp. ML1]|uniref:DUF3541 domain-containing protein n=1 Tax=Thiohalocapsa sp. ML1 TaxID=1431688 RepID=UPI0012E3DF73
MSSAAEEGEILPGRGAACVARPPSPGAGRCTTPLWAPHRCAARTARALERELVTLSPYRMGHYGLRLFRQTGDMRYASLIGWTGLIGPAWWSGSARKSAPWLRFASQPGGASWPTPSAPPVHEGLNGASGRRASQQPRHPAAGLARHL